ncbi:hypothetical protein Mapa_011429 [Marchantia paleacea]|nr:hypothetical protein Mapa_011429 [Marchantia paleacea]
MNISVLFYLFLLTFFSACSNGQDIRNPEVVALITMKKNWISSAPDFLKSWDQFGTDPCSFAHVTCGVNKSVARLELPNQHISGILSPWIGNLSNLQYLTFQNNNLTGIIPEEVKNLGQLQTLDLSNNSFTGSIPSSLGQLKSATQLMLDYNQLSGPIPDTLSALSGLKLLDLSYNNLSGLVPNISVTNFNLAGNTLLCGSQVSRDCPGDPPLPLVLFNASKSDSSPGYNKGALVCGLSVGASFLIASVAFGIAWWRRHHAKQVFFDVNEQENPNMTLGQLKKFSFRELQIATNNFDNNNILGRGGFGNVYKGVLSDGSLVAVKRLREEGTPGGEVQFQMEVEMISLAVHRNLLRLRGFCMTPTERLLVYPYMPNGSVASRLRADSIFKKSVLDWPTRKRIALGSARGLLYLHEHCDPKIIHRDVKAANVLLDEDFEAVVGDFGLAKLLDHRDSHITTAVRGTVGHIAPEYLSTGQSSEKTDVFGFGILLLELITGQRAFDFGRISSNQDVMLLDWVKKLQHEKRLDLLVDVDLKQKYNKVELEEMVQVALLCTQVSPTDRPKMAEVVRMLEGDGLAERWETWRRSESRRSSEALQMPRKYYELVEDSTFDLEAIQLSGPR